VGIIDRSTFAKKAFVPTSAGSGATVSKGPQPPLTQSRDFTEQV
jgi:hypothetical protein